MGSNGSRKLPHPWAETFGSVLSELEATWPRALGPDP